MTPKQQRFVEEFLIDLNATQAAIRAGYSAKTAEQQGYQQLQKHSVATAIAEAQARRSARTEITQDKVVQEYALVAFADIGMFVTWTGSAVHLRGSAELPPELRKVIVEVRESDNGAVRIKLHDKMRALEALGRHLGMFKDHPTVHHKREIGDYTTDELLDLLFGDPEVRAIIMRACEGRKEVDSDEENDDAPQRAH